MTATETLRYYRASRGCHRAWLASQPQFVIPGVLDEADGGQLRVVAVLSHGNPSVSSSAAPVASHRHTSPGRGLRSLPPKETP